MSTALRTYYRGHSLVTMRDEAAGQSRVYHFDHQGTTQCLTDSTGTVTDRFAADAWGVQVKRTGMSLNRQWYVGNWGYYREEPNLIQVRLRFLVPSLGTFLAVDPFETDGPSRFQYASNSPALGIDPSGAITISPTLPERWIIGTKSRCGSVRAFWNYVLDRPAPCDGWIVQKVFVIEDLSTCPPKQQRCVPGVTHEIFGSNWTDYYEAWRVRKGTKYWNNQKRKGARGRAEDYTDQGYYGGEPNRKGVFLQRGEARFFCEKDIGGSLEYQRRWNEPGSELFAPRIWTTRVQPSWWPGKALHSEGVAYRWIQSNWTCCPPINISFAKASPGLKS